MSTIECTSACTITLVVAPATLTAETVQADLVIYGAVLAFLVTIWAGKQIINLFRTGRHE